MTVDQFWTHSSARRFSRSVREMEHRIPWQDQVEEGVVLFVPDHEVVFRDEVGAELAVNADRFVSRLAAGRYLGYLKGQKAAMTCFRQRIQHDVP